MTKIPFEATKPQHSQLNRPTRAGTDEVMSDGGTAGGAATRQNRRRESSCSAGAGAGAGGSGAGTGAHRLNVFVLVRLLFHYLEKVDPRLLAEAKRALKDCDKRKREGDPEYQQLSEAIPKRIRSTVGDAHWARALAIQRNYLKQKQQTQNKNGQKKPPPAVVSRGASMERMKSAGTSKGDQQPTTPTIGGPNANDADEAMRNRSASFASGRRPHFLATGTDQHAATLSTLQQRREFSSALGPSAGGVPGLLHRNNNQQQVVLPATSASSQNSAAASVALSIQHSPFAVAQQALAAQVEALNKQAQANAAAAAAAAAPARMKAEPGSSPRGAGGQEGGGQSGSGSRSGSETSAEAAKSAGPLYADFSQYSRRDDTAFGKRQLSDKGSSSDSSASSCSSAESDIHAETETETETATAMSTVPQS